MIIVRVSFIVGSKNNCILYIQGIYLYKLTGMFFFSISNPSLYPTNPSLQLFFSFSDELIRMEAVALNDPRVVEERAAVAHHNIDLSVSVRPSLVRSPINLSSIIWAWVLKSVASVKFYILQWSGHIIFIGIMDLKYELDQLMLYNPFKNSWLKPKNKHGSRLIIIHQYPRLAAIGQSILN